MRIGIIGSGAVGCYLAGRLAAAGADVVLLARGARLAAIAADGIRIDGQQPLATRVALAADGAAAGPCDLVVSAVKAFQIAGILGDLERMLGPGGRWLCLVNGVPWWYAPSRAGELAGLALDGVDPDGRIARAIPTRRTLGCVAYLRSEERAPGHVDFSGGKGLVVGPVVAGAADPGDVISAVAAAGIPAIASADVATAFWNKLIGNIALNPLSAVTGRTAAGILHDAALRARVTAIVRETHRLMHRLGHMPDSVPEARVTAMEALGAFRTSTLQDADAGRPLEIGALIMAPLAIAWRTGVGMPATEALAAEVHGLAVRRGLLPPPG